LREAWAAPEPEGYETSVERLRNTWLGDVRDLLASASPDPSANHAPTAPTGFPPIGKRAAALVLSHQSWVRRRVESVQFLPGGETRHHISFDLAIPEELAISGQEISASEDSSLIAVPLTYMRKGALVDLDINGADGTGADGGGWCVPW